MDDRAAEPRPQLLPFDPADLVALRVRPATFARMVGVSRQAVSQWIKHGTVTLGPDGLLEPKRAARQVIENTDPAKLRARVFRQAVASHDELRQRVQGLESDLDQARADRDAAVCAAGFRERDAMAEGIGRLCDALAARWAEGTAARDAGRLDAWLDVLVGVEYFGLDPAELATAYADDDGATGAGAR